MREARNIIFTKNFYLLTNIDLVLNIEGMWTRLNLTTPLQRSTIGNLMCHYLLWYGAKSVTNIRYPQAQWLFLRSEKGKSDIGKWQNVQCAREKPWARDQNHINFLPRQIPNWSKLTSLFCILTLFEEGEAIPPIWRGGGTNLSYTLKKLNHQRKSDKSLHNCSLQ